MKSKSLGSILILISCALSLRTFAMGEPTTNGFGLNFADLGQFEDDFVRDCQRCSRLPDARFLFLAAAYGRLPLRVVTELEGEAAITVNELARENIAKFKDKIADLATGEGQVAFNAQNVTTWVGDCLDTRPMGDDFGDFDIIVADNLIHFFDGEQILNFLVTYFNLLKPGAKLYLFFNGRAPHISREMALAKNNIASLFVNTIYEISSLAEAYNKEILFPGLILDEWLLKRSEVLTHILEQKPNKSTQQNFINFQIIELLARAIGFSSISREFYELVMQEDKIAFKRVHEENHSVALVLTKDPEITAHKSKNDLDSQLVDSCVNATQLMKDFIYGDGNLIFIAPYPYVQKGPNFCKNAQCKKKGTFMCGRCKKVKYCSKECQSVDWRSAHNRSCLRQ